MESDPLRRRNSRKGFVYSLAGCGLVATNFVTAKYGLRGFDPVTFSLVWTAAATVYSFVYVLATGQARSLMIAPESRRTILVMGLATGIGMILSWEGLSRLDPSFTSFLWRLQSLLTILISFLILRERLMAIEFFPMAVMVGGGVLSTLGRWHVVGTGTTLTLLSCVTVTVQMLAAKLEAQRTSYAILVFYRLSIAVVVIAAWALLTGKMDFRVGLSFWGVTLLGALLGPCASFLLTFKAYQYWELSRATIVRTAQPLFVLPMAYLAFGSIPKGRVLLGGFLILGGAFWLGWIHLKSKRRDRQRIETGSTR